MVWIVIGIIVVIALVAWYLGRRDAAAEGRDWTPSPIDDQAPFRQEGNGGTHGSGFFSGGGNI